MSAVSVEPERMFVLGKVSFNKDLAWSNIHAGKVEVEEVDFQISDWGKKMLGLDARHPDRKPKSFLIGVDLAKVDMLPTDALSQRLLVVDTVIGTVVVDGNLRVAKAYLMGMTSLPALKVKKAHVDALKAYPINRPATAE